MTLLPVAIKGHIRGSRAQVTPQPLTISLLPHLALVSAVTYAIAIAYSVRYIFRRFHLAGTFHRR